MVSSSSWRFGEAGGQAALAEVAELEGEVGGEGLEHEIEAEVDEPAAT